MHILPINNNLTSRMNFGWSQPTHKNITHQALKSLPELSTFQDELEIFVQKPDDDELGFMVNKHFYTPLIPGDSRKVVSYMDNAFLTCHNDL